MRADVSAPAWDDYVAGRPEASVYHLAAWAGVIERVFGHRTRYLAACAGDQIVGILPLVLFSTPLFGRFATSMPFVNYGGIVADTSEAADGAAGRGRSRNTSPPRAPISSFGIRGACSRSLPVQTHKVEMVLPLQRTVDEQWRVLDRKLRNQVRKAEKSGLTVRTRRRRAARRLL